MYGKLNNGAFISAPKTLIIGDKKVFNPTAEMYKANGYKPVVNTPYPTDGKSYKQEYIETSDTILLNWVDNEREYWSNIPYDEAVNNEIRKRYTESQEFAILRQRYEKYEEYNAYYAYCEQCKAYVKEKKADVEQ